MTQSHTIADEGAFPRAGASPEEDVAGRSLPAAAQGGLTKREHFALQMHRAMLSNPSIARTLNNDDNIIAHYSEEEFARNCAQLAIMHADVLLEELAQYQETGFNPMRPHGSKSVVA